MPLTQQEAQRLQQVAMSDPRVAAIIAKLQSMPGAARGSQGGQLMAELQQALRANPTLRAAGLGDSSMSEEYSIDPRTGEVSISEGEWGDFAKFLLVGAGMAAGGYALGSVLPATAGAAAPEFAVASAPLGNAGIVANAPSMAAGGAGTTAATAATAAAASQAPRFVDRIKDLITDPSQIAGLAGLAVSTASGGRSGGDSLAASGVNDEITRSMALARQRMEQTQPVYDTLVNMAYGSTPVRSRGAAPAGYQPNQAPSGAYQYQSPRFGGM
jgi:hypothetical protein